MERSYIVVAPGDLEVYVGVLSWQEATFVGLWTKHRADAHRFSLWEAMELREAIFKSPDGGHVVVVERA